MSCEPVRYSIVHGGPYRVRNHVGDEMEVPIYRGLIEQARAGGSFIGAEDAVPQDQFRGRPLTGEYALRIYDSTSVDWSSLTDVSIDIDYTFFTRQGG